MSDLELLERRIKRERAARKAAETLLEQKSREVFEANEQLRDLADQTKAIVETAAEGIVTYDQEGIIQSFNRSAQKIFRQESAVGLNVRQLFECGEATEDALFATANSSASEISEEGDPIVPEPIEVVAVRGNGKTFLSEIAISCTSLREKVTFAALIRDLSRRKKLEARLSQAQKMESVGQLAAGIAHEINTPIQFLGNNIQFLQGAFDDLGELLNLFESLAQAVRSGSPTDELMANIETQSELADLPFLREEFPSAIEQSMEGIDRVATIVRAMKEFSQPSSDSKSSVDINHAIENALAVSVSQYRDVARVETSLDPSIAPVSCLGAQINQVLLNVITNASEAIEEHREPGTGLIKLSTRSIGDAIEIRCEDNGPGIPTEIIDRIFDPFFTTKEVGKGTGQGLAFVYDVIVNKHDGAIQAQSPAEGGTTLVMTIPVANHSLATRQQHANSTT